jgi:hypothetical protein
LLEQPILDSSLKTLLESSFIEDFKVVSYLLDNDGPLGTFSSRRKLAYLLGQIAVTEYRELELIRKIRNDCAHSHKEVNLSQSPFRERILEIKSCEDIFERLLNQKGPKLKFKYKIEDPRSRLLIIISWYCTLLDHLGHHAIRPLCPNPWGKIDQTIINQVRND